jgi:hypothetical protein
VAGCQTFDRALKGRHIAGRVLRPFRAFFLVFRGFSRPQGVALGYFVRPLRGQDHNQRNIKKKREVAEADRILAL